VWIEEGKMKRILRCAIFLLITVMFISLILPACSVGPGNSSDKSEASNIDANTASTDTSTSRTPDSLTISFQGKDAVISMDDIMKLNVVERKVTAVPKEGEEKSERSVKGIILDDLFQKYLGTAQKDLFAIKFVAGDGYAIEVEKDLLQTRKIVLAYEVDGKPLKDKDKPLRSIVPDVFEMYWVKNLVKIEVIEEREQSQINSIILMETRISSIPDQEYKYLQNTDRAVRISDLLLGSGDEKDPEVVFIKSVDGLEKNENPGIFTGALIKYTGEDSPQFTSLDIPLGMWVKKILFFNYGNFSYFSVSRGLESFEKSGIEGRTSIKLSDVFSNCGIADAQKYIFKAVDGYTVEIEKGSIASGYLYKGDDGLPAVFFEGLPKNTSVKDLLSISIE
jgi:hypothetical protein